MYITCRRPSPGMRARTPMSSGDALVSQTFTVAHRSWERAAEAGAARARAHTSAARDAGTGRNIGGNCVNTLSGRRLPAQALSGRNPTVATNLVQALTSSG